MRSQEWEQSCNIYTSADPSILNNGEIYNLNIVFDRSTLHLYQLRMQNFGVNNLISNPGRTVSPFEAQICKLWPSV